MTQRNEALRLANATRLANADLKRHIHSLPEDEGRRVLVAVLTDPDDAQGAAYIEALLTSVHHFGQSQARRVLRFADVNAPSKRVRELTARQRAVVIKALRDPSLISPSSRKPKLEDVA